MLGLLKWSDFCKSLLVEAKWQKRGYTPCLQEYLSNAWISSSGTVLSVHSFFGIMKEATEETAGFLKLNQDLVYNSSLIIRLCNDLGTSSVNFQSRIPKIWQMTWFQFSSLLLLVLSFFLISKLNCNNRRS